jgi:dinuclear metal center YbgI/SA1388 family protein
MKGGTPMTLNGLLSICHEIAPLDCVWSGDNVGLLVDREGGDISRVLVALDVSMAVISEAASIGAQVIISHHPVIFAPVKSVTYGDYTGKRVIELIKNNIACICMHTNYDGAANGINDELARIAGIVNPETLINQDGEYGRYGLIEAPMELKPYAEKIKLALNGAAVRAYDAGKPVHKVCVGSGGSGGIMPYVLEAECDTFITGDVRHPVFCEARDMGLNLIDAGHFATEDIMCDLLINELSKRAPKLEVTKAANSVKPYYEVM